MTRQLTVGFPLVGEWYVGADGTEPGHELAFDFMRLDQHLRATSRPILHELFAKVPYEEYLGWGQPITSPFAGRVVTAVDGVAEHPRSYLAKLLGNLRAAFSTAEKRRLAELENSQSGDIRPLAGNHLVIESLEQPNVFAFLAHARLGSLRVGVGDAVAAGQPVAEVGDSGQSLLPHLHFHVMATPNPLDLQLIPFNFAAYEVFREGQWERQCDTKPTRRQRVRSL